jgi:hypothetical protein
MSLFPSFGSDPETTIPGALNEYYVEYPQKNQPAKTGWL